MSERVARSRQIVWQRHSAPRLVTDTCECGLNASRYFCRAKILVRGKGGELRAGGGEGRGGGGERRDVF